MLKYGKDSIRSQVQPLKEICRDLHCQRDRYTWTSHPALEGTSCAESKVNFPLKLFISSIKLTSEFGSLPKKWCRSGLCVVKTAVLEKYTVVTKQTVSDTTADRTNLIDGKKFGDLVKSEHTLNRMTLVSDYNYSRKTCHLGLQYFKRNYTNNPWKVDCSHLI